MRPSAVEHEPELNWKEEQEEENPNSSSEVDENPWEHMPCSITTLILGKAGRIAVARCEAACKLFAELVRDENIPYDTDLFKFERPFDDNGALWHIMSAHGKLQASASSNAQGKAEDFICHTNPNTTHCTRATDKDGWMAVDLGVGRWLTPHYYCLRHGYSGEYYMRNWRLQVTNYPCL